MSLVIDLPRPVEARIEQEAREAGVTASELAADVIKKNFSVGIDVEEQKRLNAPGIALIQSWLDEARKPRTPEELAEAEDDLEKLMRALNETRRQAGERILFPDIEENL